MRKIYLSVLFLLGVSTVMAQDALLNHKMKTTRVANHQSLPTIQDRNAQPSSNNSAAVIWTDDFSDPSTWVMTEETGSGDNWVIDATGPIGSFSIGPIESTSAGDGWATFDSDNLCSGDQIANLTTATSINCTGHPNVVLKFEEWYRKYYDSTFVYVSNDNVNWTKFIVHAGYTDNDFVPANPTVTSVNITSVAGNEATVWISFQFWSPSTFNAAAGCGYAWQIDDVSVEDLPSDDIAIIPAFPSEYAIIPLIEATPIDISARITNVGGNTETNVGFTALVALFQGSNFTIIFEDSVTQASLLPSDTTPVLSAGSITPMDTGIYYFLYITKMTNADGDQTNDTLENWIIVDDNVYARDYVNIDGQLPYYVGHTAPIKLAQTFDFPNACSINSVTFYLTPVATIGDATSVDIYSTIGGLPSAVLRSSASHTITSADTTNGFVTLNLTTPLNVSAGALLAININQTTANNLGLGAHSEIFTPGAHFYKIGTGAWTAFNVSYVLRPNVDLPVGVNETNFSKNIEIFPNPTNGKVFIYNGNNVSQFNVTVTNSIGEIVMTNSYSNLTNATIDLSSQASGVYSVQIKSDENVTTKSIVVNNK
jgi:hypothetical protein